MEQISIGNQQIAVKEFKGQRVVTFKDIDTVHERPDGTARKRFNDNKKRLIEERDYFKICPSEFRTHFDSSLSNMVREDITLITERGYLMLVKSFTDDLAWDVQGQLVDIYFVKPMKKLSALEQLELQGQAILEVNKKVDTISKELHDFKNDMPVLPCDLDRIKFARNQKIVPMLGGKKSNAYNDHSIRAKVYSDNASQLCREFDIKRFDQLKRSQTDEAIEVIGRYELPKVLKDNINDANAQITL